MFTDLIASLNEAGLPYERALSANGRDRLAAMYEQNSDLIQMVSANLLLNFITLNTFEKKEYEAYLKAINDVGLYMAGALKEYKAVTNTKTEN